MTGYWTTNPDEPEEAIAYPEAHIKATYKKYGLNIKPPIRYGRWPGRGTFLSYQDVLIAEKAAD
jgi:hypothetical protein